MSDSKTIILTLEEAKKLYNSHDTNLIDIALRAYSKEDLEYVDFKNIKTISDVCKALKVNESVLNDLEFVSKYRMSEANQSKSIIKLHLIHKALNGDWKPDFFNTAVFFPNIKIFSVEYAQANPQSVQNAAGKFRYDKKDYLLVCNDVGSSSEGMMLYGCGYGNIMADLGLLGCRTMEIAKHFGKYFAKEIFDAIYSRYGKYEWI